MSVKGGVIAALRKLSLLPLAFRVDQSLRALAFRFQSATAGGNDRYGPDAWPIPPARLRVVVARTADVAWFLQSGALAAATIEERLQQHGLAIDQFQAILDFGCGCGRVIRHWHRLQGPAIHGTDVDSRLIEWCRRSLPFAEFRANSLSPPTSYGGAQFDFIYALSVLTHLPESHQGAWMRELSRILRPGGYLMMTTHGARYRDKLTPEESARFDAGKLVVKYPEGIGTTLCIAFHPPEYVRQVLARGFQVVDFVAEGARGNIYQDLFLLRRLA